MSREITVYHGSNHIVEAPLFGIGRKTNDYGLGFYMTESRLLAGEWAVLWTGRDGFINEYQLNLDGLDILNLDQLPIENWIAVLMLNRRGEYADELQGRLDRFIEKFGIDLSGFDMVKGYRANDAFFRYVEAFTLGLLSLENLLTAMKLGDLGAQICLKTERAFSAIRFVDSTPAAASAYFPPAQYRDTTARQQYRSMKNKDAGRSIFDLLRGDSRDSV